MANKDGGPAFPSVGEGFDNPLYSAPGMTLRDWFAGQAMAAFIAGHGAAGGPQPPRPGIAARAAYKYADAMLAGREK